MKAQKIALDHYKDAEENFYIHKVSGNCEAQRLHFHDYFQIYYILRGNIIHVMDNKEIGLARGDAFIIPPGRTHRIVMGSAETEFFSFSFTKSFFDNRSFGATYPGKFLIFLQSETNAVRPKISVSSDKQMFLETMMQSVMEEFKAKRTGYIYAIQGVLSAVLTVFARVYFEINDSINCTEFEKYRKSMLSCIEYIQNNYMNEITLSEITRIAAMSRTNFCNFFRMFTNMSFKQYLNKLRIDKAMNLIRHTQYDINQIVEMCGYNDYSTFYRNFLRGTGMSPSDVKRISNDTVK